VEAGDFVISIGKTAETGDEYLTSHPKERENANQEAITEEKAQKQRNRAQSLRSVAFYSGEK
jgi:hypothetical protein